MRQNKDFLSGSGMYFLLFCIPHIPNIPQKMRPNVIEESGIARRGRPAPLHQRSTEREESGGLSGGGLGGGLSGRDLGGGGSSGGGEHGGQHKRHRGRRLHALRRAPRTSATPPAAAAAAAGGGRRWWPMDACQREGALLRGLLRPRAHQRGCASRFTR